ncbi:hypothetical protein [Halobellus sp. H-GB7]|uniref:hypothetical protein n=1 Tax=Halobellus sp. H-GB7 TaxID=3069756 RepID=UPI0027B0BF73|nr:hypothetical protein [Halobellus sp. H-GB7]MDQ2054125.1 hypothetical protein [Halobellus sp. H-GB7]
MITNTKVRNAGPQSSVDIAENEFNTDLQQSDWNWQPDALSDRADAQYTDKGWKSASSVAADTPELSPSSARTTFYPRDIDWVGEFRDRRELFDRLWKRQWNRGQKEVGDNNLVRREAKLQRCDAILQQCEVQDVAKKYALRQIRIQDLRGYSRHYSGADGACVGFAMYEMYSDQEEAVESYVAGRAVEVLPRLDANSIKNLIDYTFRRQNNE